MTNSDWWDRAKTPPRPETIPVRPRQRVCMLRKDQLEATLETRAVPTVSTNTDTQRGQQPTFVSIGLHPDVAFVLESNRDAVALILAEQAGRVH